MTGAIASGMQLMAGLDEGFGWEHAHKPPVRLWYGGGVDSAMREDLVTLLASSSGEVSDRGTIS